jgi:hypothetical protein
MDGHAQQPFYDGRNGASAASGCVGRRAYRYNAAEWEEFRTLLENRTDDRIVGKEPVMIELTEQQRQELSAPKPVAIDPQTRQTYVLVRREIYERLKALLGPEDYDPEEGAAYINEVMTEDDAKDPYLEGYQNYGKQA